MINNLTTIPFFPIVIPQMTTNENEMPATEVQASLDPLIDLLFSMVVITSPKVICKLFMVQRYKPEI